MEPGVREGVRLFNRRKFFEAHEALEAVWLKSAGQDKLFLHGLIQVAAAFHHLERKNRMGFHSLLEKGGQKLESVGDTAMEVDVARLRESLSKWRLFLEGHGNAAADAPKLPKIRRAASRKKFR
jgi:uncharacterized protein